jgi:hypothetical protein
MFYLTQAGSGWSLAPWYSSGPPPVATVAVERLRAAPTHEAVWFVRADEHVGKLSSPLTDFGSLPYGIWDIGAGAGVVWVVSATQSSDPGARGNSLWRLDPSAKRWNRLSPGWAVAVDADEDGNAWVLDSEGKLHVRGARMPAVFDNFRGMPKPGESWDEYFALLTSGPGLYPELAVQSRLSGAGGTVYLAAWDDYAAFSDELKSLYKQALAKLLEKERGIELLYCIAPIFTGQRACRPILRRDQDRRPGKNTSTHGCRLRTSRCSRSSLRCPASWSACATCRSAMRSIPLQQFDVQHEQRSNY